jgi:hypothetical protein
MAVEHLTYEQTSYDTSRLAAGQTKFFHVDAAPDSSAGVTDLEEKQIIRWIMGNPLARKRMLAALRLPDDTTYRAEVVRPFYTLAERDIDLILCPRNSPQIAVALECKRLKIRSLNPDQDQLTKLQEIAHGVIQANELYNGRNAFFQTYLCIIAEVEAFSEQGGFEADENIPCRGIRSHTSPARGDKGRTTLKQMVEFPGRERLHRDVGILHFEIVQPSHNSIDQRGNIRALVYRRAECRDQFSSLTNRVAEIMR